MKKLTDKEIEEYKKLIKELIAYAYLPTKIIKVENIHPNTAEDILYHAHAIQSILVCEYVKLTDLNKELNLR